MKKSTVKKDNIFSAQLMKPDFVVRGKGTCNRN